MSASYDEVQVFDGIGERTGNCVDRTVVRGHRNACRSVGELSAKSRRLGDGYYYLVSGAWPAPAATLDLAMTWASIA